MILPEDYINRPVRSLQTMLRVLSTIFPALLNVNPDGIYGESTKNAVSAFQRFAHLPATGIAETLSRRHISVPTRIRGISYAVFCLEKKKGKEGIEDDVECLKRHISTSQSRRKYREQRRR